MMDSVTESQMNAMDLLRGIVAAGRRDGLLQTVEMDWPRSGEILGGLELDDEQALQPICHGIDKVFS